MRTRVKICGLTRPEDVDAAVAEGADALGFNLFPQSKRFIDLDRLEALADRVPPFVARVGLFVNATVQEVSRSLDRVPFELLQFHGDEDDAFCAQFDRPYIKTLRLQTVEAVRVFGDDYPSAAGCLLDAHVEGLYGGTGHTLDWSLLTDLEQKIILAGGLKVDNVAEAISIVRPYALDLCSGVESAPGVKDLDLMRRFFAAVRAADRSVESE